MVAPIIGPFVTSSQASKVTAGSGTFGNMEQVAERLAFAARLNELCDDNKIPAKDQGRQAAVAKIFRVSQKGARKWLEGEGYPTLDRCEQIARWAGVNFEWLMTGRGPKPSQYAPQSPAIDRVVSMMQTMEPEHQYLVSRIADSVAELPKTERKKSA